jgi:Phytanoyl-CoA dioxygenase (PhyH)
MTLSPTDAVLDSGSSRMPGASSDVDPLSAERVASFVDRGYVVLPSFLSRGEVDGLKREVDSWLDDGLREASIECALRPSRTPPPTMELELPRHGALVSHPPLMAVLSQLLGEVFAFHHMHSTRHDPGTGGKQWHHDYEQRPQAARTHTMVHVFHYLNGLDGTIGDLVLLPGSHRIVAEKDALAAEGTEHLHAEVVLDDLPHGSTVVVHSALFHARRPQPGGDTARYFIDASYCQGGTTWPVVKPYWVAMLDRARELRLDRGRWPELFDQRHFYEPDGGWADIA